MGADRRMFPAPWTSLPGFIAHDWPNSSGDRTIESIAGSVVDSFDINDGDVVVGASLGGMVACEIAKIRKLEALVLVGSATDPSEINKLLTLLHPLSEIAPINWIRISAGKIPADLTQMFSTVDAAFIRHMCSAIFQWQGLQDTMVPLHRIHGRRDLVIPPPSHADLLLDGGHLISMTHASECITFLKSIIDS
jgi:pimeloyl-ACP methyl ester carboxylesterase